VAKAIARYRAWRAKNNQAAPYCEKQGQAVLNYEYPGHPALNSAPLPIPNVSAIAPPVPPPPVVDAAAVACRAEDMVIGVDVGLAGREMDQLEDAASPPGIEPSDIQKRKLIARAELTLAHFKALLSEMRWFSTSHCPQADGMADGIAKVERSLNMMERELDALKRMTPKS